MTDLEQFDALNRTEQSAFLALFAGARGNLSIFRRGDTGKEQPPFFGKAECEWVPFREFWQEKMPALGWTIFEESEPQEAKGMVPGSTFTEVTIHVTHKGRAVREAYWSRLDRKIAERANETSLTQEPQ